jgi:predicted membrane protein
LCIDVCVMTTRSFFFFVCVKWLFSHSSLSPVHVCISFLLCFALCFLFFFTHSVIVGVVCASACTGLCFHSRKKERKTPLRPHTIKEKTEENLGAQKPAKRVGGGEAAPLTGPPPFLFFCLT